MAGNYIFNIQIFSKNRYQVGLDDYLYSYRGYEPETEEEWIKEFGNGDFHKKIGFELEDFYSGDFFEKTGNYPEPRGPGGGGWSASSYIRDVATGSITPTARTSYSTSDVLDVIMVFDKDKVLSNNGEGVKKIESDLRYVIETAFKNSTVKPKKQEVYIDAEFTRDTGYPASPSQTSSKARIVWKIEGQVFEEDEEGKPKKTYANPAYTPNGKTYSVPQTPDYKLYKSFQSETTDEYYLYYYINELVPTPAKDPATQSGSQSVSETSTASEESLSKGEYVFNVEKSKTFTNSQFGDLSIIEKAEPSEGEEGDAFIFGDEQVDDVLDSEYIESEFSGPEEEIISFSDGFPVFDIDKISEIKNEDPENPDENLTTGKTPFPISKDVDKNIRTIIESAKKIGITNKFAISAMLAICKKESGLIPRSESSYAKTPVSTIKRIFSAFSKSSDAAIDRIKSNPEEFFDLIYGNKYGNGPKEGFKYRGRGLNQITFKGNYKTYFELTKHDIINNPDLLNDIDVASDCLSYYFKRNFQKAPPSIKDRYNFSDINSFTKLEDATGAFYHANAGWAKSYSEIIADKTGGRKKAFNYVGSLYEKYKNIM